MWKLTQKSAPGGTRVNARNSENILEQLPYLKIPSLESLNHAPASLLADHALAPTWNWLHKDKHCF